MVHGWGINDVDYSVTKREIIGGKFKQTWRCPYYELWRGIIVRCRCQKLKGKYQSYKDCTISEEWKYLSDFIKWVDSQPNRDWQNCSLDKDFLILGNKHYSPDTAVFIPASINTFILDCSKSRGNYMIGVTCRPTRNKNRPYVAQCGNPFTKRQEPLGYFSTEMEAHLAWKSKKHEHACKLAELHVDERVAKRLKTMYSPEADWTRK